MPEPGLRSKARVLCAFLNALSTSAKLGMHVLPTEYNDPEYAPQLVELVGGKGKQVRQFEWFVYVAF